VKKAKPGLGIVLVLASGLALSACTTKAGWQYEPGPARVATSRVPAVVAVEHFQDQRSTENKRYFFLCALPLVPYCTATYHRPENANGFLTEGAYNFRPSDDLAQAAVTELRQAQIFSDVYLTDRTADPNSQLVVRGTITNTDWDGSAYGYMLGPYSSLLWILGAPLGAVHDTLTLRLELVETASGRVLWTSDINQTYDKTEGFYYNFAEDFGYPQMFRDGITPAIASLESYIASQPPGFWDHLRASPTERN
jgi:hypothetical protein